MTTQKRNIICKQSILILLVFTGTRIFAQHKEHENHHVHIGVGTGATFITNENTPKPAFHLHLMKSLKHGSDYSFGLGYEVIKSDKLHQEITAFAGYYLAENLIIEAGPGITFEKANDRWETGLSGHIECSYEFQIGSVHLGPMVGVGVDREDFHATLGIHFGFGL